MFLHFTFSCERVSHCPTVLLVLLVCQTPVSLIDWHLNSTAGREGQIFEIMEVAAGVSTDMFLFAGGTVHMVCRNKGRAEAAKDEIVEQSKNEVRCQSHVCLSAFHCDFPYLNWGSKSPQEIFPLSFSLYVHGPHWTGIFSP